MTDQYRISWLALPQGVAGSRLRVAAMASIQATTTGPAGMLGAFKALLDWPALAEATQFSLLRGATALPLQRLALPEEGALAEATAWWTALFDAKTPVTRFHRDRLPGAVVSYDQGALVQAIATTYGAALARYTGIAPPALSTMNRDLTLAALETLARPTGTTSHGYNGYRAAMAAAAANLRANAAAMKLPSLADIEAELDFHRRLSALDTLPAMLRRLRLVMTFTVDAAAFAAASGETITIVAKPPADPQRMAATAQATAFDPAHFLPRRGGGAPAGVAGLLRIKGDVGRPVLDVVTVDAEGAVSKTDALLATAKGLEASDQSQIGSGANPAAPPDGGLPALRVQGLALVVHDQAAQVTAAADAVTRLERLGALPPLDGDQLTLGWRVEISDLGPPQPSGQPPKPDHWRSLHRRTAHFTIQPKGPVKLDPTRISRTPAGLTLRVDDEGYVSQSGFRNGVGAAADTTTFVHPALAVWKGWSLSVPLPSFHVDPAATGDPASSPMVVDPKNDAVGAIGLSVTFDGANRLPVLRYRHRYRVRLRAVDLSGWSTDGDIATLPGKTPSIAPSDTVTEPVPFLRLDPVAPPVLAYVTHAGTPSATPGTVDGLEGPKAGESMTRLVIRALANEPPRSRRLAFPNRVTFETAERHGVLDVGGTLPKAGTPAYDALYTMLAQRDRSDGASKIPERPVALEYRALGLLLAAETGSEVTVQPATAVDPSIPYLPDPLAGETQFSVETIRALTPGAGASGGGGAGGQKGPSFRKTGAPWFDMRPFLIELEGSTGPAGVRLVPADSTTPVDRLIVGLPPSEALRLHLWAKIEDADIDLFQLVAWAIAQDPNNRNTIRRRVGDGSWLVSPRRTIEFVHAVDKPLATPDFVPSPDGGPLTAARGVGMKDLGFSFQTYCHVNSTGRVDLLAHWREPGHEAAVAGSPAPVDTLEGPASHWTVDDSLPGPKVTAELTSTVLATFAGTHSLPDTRYRCIMYRLAATTRFREYMPKELRDPPDPATRVGGVDPRTAVFNISRSQFIPATKAPPAPIVDMILPTFAWTRRTDGDHHISLRRGRSLRVYLGSRWFDSGFNEMLAVILPSGIETAGEAITEWGSDPQFPDTTLPALDRGRFPRRFDSTKASTQRPALFATSGGQHAHEFDALPTLSLLTPPAFPPLTPPVPSAPAPQTVAHLVDYDVETGAFFCDIDLDAGPAYRPMTRLVLARLQPVAVDGARLSATVATDFLPVLPDRGVDAFPMINTGIEGNWITVRFHGQASIATSGLGFERGVTLQGRHVGASIDTGWQDMPTDPTVKMKPPGGAYIASIPGTPPEFAGLPFLDSSDIQMPPPTPNTVYRLLAREWELYPNNAGGTDKRLSFFETIDL